MLRFFFNGVELASCTLPVVAGDLGDSFYFHLPFRFSRAGLISQLKPARGLLEQ